MESLALLASGHRSTTTLSRLAIWSPLLYVGGRLNGIAKAAMDRVFRSGLGLGADPGGVEKDHNPGCGRAFILQNARMLTLTPIDWA